jgi:hypothetical protein
MYPEPYETIIVNYDLNRPVARARCGSQTHALIWIIAALEEHDGNCAGVVNEWRFDDRIDDFVIKRTGHVVRYQNAISWEKRR